MSLSREEVKAIIIEVLIDEGLIDTPVTEVPDIAWMLVSDAPTV